MTQPFIITQPDQAPELPLVFDSPHSGTDYPESFTPVDPHAVNQLSDLFVDELYDKAPTYGATLLKATFPRGFVDPNRHENEMDNQVLSAPWPHDIHESKNVTAGRAVIWRRTYNGAEIYKQPLSVEEAEKRIEQFYQPYLNALGNIIAGLHKRHGKVWHINCHSMPSTGSKLSPDTGEERPDFVLGDRHGTTCGAHLMDIVHETLTNMGYTVAVNDPYQGAELVRRFSAPDKNIHSLQIEVNRRLYMHEEKLIKKQSFDQLKGDLTVLVKMLGSFVQTF